MKMLTVGLLLAMLAACGGGGGDEEAPKKTTQTPATPPVGGGAAPAPGAGSANKPLPVVRRVEESPWITCPSPKRDAKKCELDAPKAVSIGKEKPDPATDKSCPEDMYCLPTTEGYLCGICEERSAIRHQFKDRDFAGETNRDPFQSFLIKAPGGAGLGSGDIPRDTTNRCQKADQMRVPNYGYMDLKLVGIVTQGTQRKVLMMSPDNYGHIIKRGDCVGKEKAWVREIAENFICFEVSQDAAVVGVRPPEGICVELHTKQVSVTSIPSEAPAGRTSAPVIQPPGASGPVTQPTPGTQPRPQPQQPPQPPAQPQQPPVNLKP